MRLVYVAGPFRGPNAWEIEENIRRAERLALEVWRLGAACICPHTNTRHFQGAAPDSVWLEGDLEILCRCDAVILAPHWSASSGARAEVERAKALSIPVFSSLGSLKHWLFEPRQATRTEGDNRHANEEETHEGPEAPAGTEDAAAEAARPVRRPGA